MTTATPVRLPVGNTGREYCVTNVADDDYAFPVRVEPMTGRRALPSTAAMLRGQDARILGVRLIELAAFADAGLDAVDAPRPVDVYTYGGRGYRAVLRPAVLGQRRVRLVASARHGATLPSLSDSFTSADARALGTALIAAAGAP